MKRDKMGFPLWARVDAGAWSMVNEHKLKFEGLKRGLPPEEWADLELAARQKLIEHLDAYRKSNKRFKFHASMRKRDESDTQHRPRWRHVGDRSF